MAERVNRDEFNLAARTNLPSHEAPSAWEVAEAAREREAWTRAGAGALGIAGFVFVCVALAAQMLAPRAIGVGVVLSATAYLWAVAGPQSRGLADAAARGLWATAATAVGCESCLSSDERTVDARHHAPGSRTRPKPAA